MTNGTLCNTRHYLAWQAFRASLEPEALAESIAAAEFLAWREACHVN